MANSRIPGPERPSDGGVAVPARTPGITGVNDQADPNVHAALGDTPGPSGVNDRADATLPPYDGTPQPSVAKDGTKVAPATTEPPATPVIDAAIEALDLAPNARTAAYALKKAHPTVKFTSGRRAKDDQARAMAGNVVTNRKWIEQTYKKSTLRTNLQDWVDNNKDAKTKAAIQAGLESVLDAATDAELGDFSKHLSGLAFDVQPVTKDADDIKKTIRGLDNLDLFLDTEGGLVRWHAQFN
jgi:hypothetical protein